MVLLDSFSSKKMKNALIYQMDVNDASAIKNKINTLLGISAAGLDKFKFGVVPAPRDGHSAVLYKNMMVVFGGDRNKFPYNDLFMFKI